MFRYLNPRGGRGLASAYLYGAQLEETGPGPFAITGQAPFPQWWKYIGTDAVDLPLVSLAYTNQHGKAALMVVQNAGSGGATVQVQDDAFNPIGAPLNVGETYLLGWDYNNFNGWQVIATWGGGSTPTGVNVANDGAAVAGGPFNTIDGIGGGFVNAGGGVAEYTPPGGGGGGVEAENDGAAITGGPFDTLNLLDSLHGEDAGGGKLDVTVKTVRTARLTLTDAEIKALPDNFASTPIVAAPPAGFMHLIRRAIIYVDATAGIYTNIAANNGQLSVDLDDVVTTVRALYNNTDISPARTDLTALLTNAGFAMVAFLQEPEQGFSPSSGLPWGERWTLPVSANNYLASPITLTCLNEFDGAFTGGHPSNFMTVTVEYCTVNPATGEFI